MIAVWTLIGTVDIDTRRHARLWSLGCKGDRYRRHEGTGRGLAWMR